MTGSTSVRPRGRPPRASARSIPTTPSQSPTGQLRLMGTPGIRSPRRFASGRRLTPWSAGVWIAVSSASTTYVAARRPINATGIDATLSGYGVGSGGFRIVTPNNDGITDTVPIAWTTNTAQDSLVLNVWRADGSLAGSMNVPGTALGSHTYAWDGRIGGAIVGDGQYVLQFVGTKGASCRRPRPRSRSPLNSWRPSG